MEGTLLAASYQDQWLCLPQHQTHHLVVLKICAQLHTESFDSICFSIPFTSDLPIAACLYNEHAGACFQLVQCPVSTHIWVHPCSPYFEDPARTKVNGELVAVLLTRYYESSFHLLAACPILLLQQVVLQHHHAGGVQHKPSVLPPFHYIGEHTQLSLKVSHSEKIIN